MDSAVVFALVSPVVSCICWDRKLSKHFFLFWSWISAPSLGVKIDLSPFYARFQASLVSKECTQRDSVFERCVFFFIPPPDVVVF